MIMKKTKISIIIVLILIGAVFLNTLSATASLVNTKNKTTLTDGLGSLDGIVKKWGNGPLEEAHVYIAGGHISLAEFDISVVLNQNLTDVQGYYFIDEIPEGKYTILVLRHGFGGGGDKWVPALRHTTVYSGQTTTEDFNLKPLGRNLILTKLFNLDIFKLLSQIF
jgi:hypothetical protein